MERRDTGSFKLRATPTPNIDVTAGFTTTHHPGEFPYLGGSFGFSNGVELAAPLEPADKRRHGRYRMDQGPPHATGGV